MEVIDKKDLINYLSLIRHDEGGYYRETYRSPDCINTNREHHDGVRCLSTCIFYMLTNDNPIGFFHKNKSPILHFYHGGGSLTYRFIHPNGMTEEHILGPDIRNGHKLQLVAPGDVWKSTSLNDGEFGLVSEVVFPGWEIYDSIIADYSDLLALHPEHAEWIERYSYGVTL